MSTKQKYEDRKDAVGNRKEAKRKAIAKRQQRRWSTKNGAEILFGVVWPNQKWVGRW